MTDPTAVPRPSTAALIRRPLVALAGAAASALVLGGVVFALVLSTGGRDRWDDLVAAVLGMLAAAATAVLVWVLLLLRGARRSFPKGRRAVPVLLTLGTGGAAVVMAVWLSAAVGEGRAPDVALLLPVPLAALSVAVFPWWQRRLDRATTAGRR